MIQAVLLEFEGVIADTGEARREALLHALEADGIALGDDEYDVWCDARPTRSAVRAAMLLRQRSPDETSIDLATARAVFDRANPDALKQSRKLARSAVGQAPNECCR